MGHPAPPGHYGSTTNSTMPNLPPKSDDVLDFEDPPKYLTDKVCRTFWYISKNVRDVLKSAAWKARVKKGEVPHFCLNKGFCRYFEDKKRLDDHLKKNPSHKVANIEDWHAEAERRMAVRKAAGIDGNRQRSKVSPSSSTSSSTASRGSRSPTPQRPARPRPSSSSRRSNSPPVTRSSRTSSNRIRCPDCQMDFVTIEEKRRHEKNRVKECRGFQPPSPKIPHPDLVAKDNKDKPETEVPVQKPLPVPNLVPPVPTQYPKKFPKPTPTFQRRNSKDKFDTSRPDTTKVPFWQKKSAPEVADVKSRPPFLPFSPPPDPTPIKPNNTGGAIKREVWSTSVTASATSTTTSTKSAAATYPRPSQEQGHKGTTVSPAAIPGGSIDLIKKLEMKLPTPEFYRSSQTTSPFAEIASIKKIRDPRKRKMPPSMATTTSNSTASSASSTLTSASKMSKPDEPSRVTRSNGGGKKPNKISLAQYRSKQMKDMKMSASTDSEDGGDVEIIAKPTEKLPAPDMMASSLKPNTPDPEQNYAQETKEASAEDDEVMIVEESDGGQQNPERRLSLDDQLEHFLKKKGSKHVSSWTMRGGGKAKDPKSVGSASENNEDSGLETMEVADEAGASIDKKENVNITEEVFIPRREEAEVVEVLSSYQPEQDQSAHNDQAKAVPEQKANDTVEQVMEEEEEDVLETTIGDDEIGFEVNEMSDPDVEQPPSRLRKDENLEDTLNTPEESMDCDDMINGYESVDKNTVIHVDIVKPEVSATATPEPANTEDEGTISKQEALDAVEAVVGVLYKEPLDEIVEVGSGIFTEELSPDQSNAVSTTGRKKPVRRRRGQSRFTRRPRRGRKNNNKSSRTENESDQTTTINEPIETKTDVVPDVYDFTEDDDQIPVKIPILKSRSPSVSDESKEQEVAVAAETKSKAVQKRSTRSSRGRTKNEDNESSPEETIRSTRSKGRKNSCQNIEEPLSNPSTQPNLKTVAELAAAENTENDCDTSVHNNNDESPGDSDGSEMVIMEVTLAQSAIVNANEKPEEKEDSIEKVAEVALTNIVERVAEIEEKQQPDLDHLSVTTETETELEVNNVILVTAAELENSAAEIAMLVESSEDPLHSDSNLEVIQNVAHDVQVQDEATTKTASGGMPHLEGDLESFILATSSPTPTSTVEVDITTTSAPPTPTTSSALLGGQGQRSTSQKARGRGGARGGRGRSLASTPNPKSGTLIKGVDASIDYCPVCSARLCPFKGGYSVNCSTFDVTVDCVECDERIVIKESFSEDEKTMLWPVGIVKA